MVKQKENNHQLQAKEDHSSKETALTFIHRCAGREDEDTNKLEVKNISR